MTLTVIPSLLTPPPPPDTNPKSNSSSLSKNLQASHQLWPPTAPPHAGQRVFSENEIFNFINRRLPPARPDGCGLRPHFRKGHPELQGALNIWCLKLRPQTPSPLVVSPHPTGGAYPQSTPPALMNLCIFAKAFLNCAFGYNKIC